MLWIRVMLLFISLIIMNFDPLNIFLWRLWGIIKYSWKLIESLSLFLFLKLMECFSIKFLWKERKHNSVIKILRFCWKCAKKRWMLEINLTTTSLSLVGQILQKSSIRQQIWGMHISNLEIGRIIWKRNGNYGLSLLGRTIVASDEWREAKIQVCTIQLK